MNKFYISMFAIVLSLGLNAQNVTKGVAFTTGGSYNAPGNHVKLYALDTDSLESWIVDSVPGDFSNHVVVDGHFAYMHVGRGAGHPLGGDRIFKYDILNFIAPPLDSTNEISGLKKFEIQDGKLILTRGFPATTYFVKVLDANDLQTELYVDSLIQGACDGIAITDGKAYVATTNFNDTAEVNVFNLGASVSYEGAITLDTLSNGASNIFVGNGNVYLTHLRYRPNYSVWYAGVTSVNLADSSFVTDTTGMTASAGFDYYSGKILGNFGNPIEEYDVATGTRSQFVATYPTAAKKDPNSSVIAVQTTDYFSFGEVTLYDGQGNVVFVQSSDFSGSALQIVTNNYPTAVADTINDTLLVSPLTISVLDNDYDLDGDAFEILAIAQNPNFGTAVITGNEIVYTPNSNFVPDSLIYVIEDAWGDTSIALVTIDTVGVVNSVREFENSFIATIYPNPANSVLNIRTGNVTIEEVQIIDLTGRLVKTIVPVANQTQINVSQFKAGIYIVQVTVNGNVETHRLVIQ